MLTNEMNGVSVSNCELLVDTGNTACDLLLSFRNACKFQLTQSKARQTVTDVTGRAVIVKMLPSLLVNFALRTTEGSIVCKEASVDAWVKADEITAYPALPTISISERTQAVGTQAVGGKVRLNCPTPAKHRERGSAILGCSGLRKLQLKYDAETDEISSLDHSGDLPQI